MARPLDGELAVGADRNNRVDQLAIYRVIVQQQGKSESASPSWSLLSIGAF